MTTAPITLTQKRARASVAGGPRPNARPRRSKPPMPSLDCAHSACGLTPGWHLAVIEHAADAIVVSDLAGTIHYVNPAFERDTGLRREAAIGQHLRILDGGQQPAAHLRAMWATIRRGEIWAGELIHRRADGTDAQAWATVAPIRDEAGSIVGAVAVQRDVSRERALEARLAEHQRERTALAAGLEAIRAGETAEATAAAIGLALLRLPGLGGVAICSFEGNGEVVPLATLDRDGRAAPTAGPLPPERTAYLRERASHGPWIEEWEPRADHPYHAALVERGVRALAYAPIRSDGDVIGLLIATARSGELDLAERLPALVECASFAGAMLGPQLRTRTARVLAAAHIGAVIADRAFVPVFQPIVELTSRVAVGYEALTRFADGSPPERVFAEAAWCGLGRELEAATLEAILEASGPLPAAAWLNLNVSPEFVLAGEPLASLVRRWGYWQIVLELTEHIEVTDYAGLREAIRGLGPNVRLAVDDVGAGFASFRHILELRPDYVKLDRGLVRTIGRDPARQALVAGLAHFALKTGAILVAEGVETEAEARRLRELGVHLAQGYRLGRPALAPRLIRAAPGVGLQSPHIVGGRRPREGAQAVAGEDIGRVVNIGGTLAAGLTEVGISSAEELRALGALPAWERLRQARPRLATVATLQRLEGAVRGIRVSQLSPADRARLRLFARLGRAAL